MRRTSAGPDVAPESALARLLEVESRLEQMLEEARQEAEATLRAAGARADARAETLAAELRAADVELSAALAAEAAGRIGAEQEALAQIRARYEAVGDQGVEALATWVLEQVLAAVGTEAP